MKRSLLLVPLVVIFLGCTVQQDGTGGNQTYRGIGITTFYADAYDLPSGSITNIKLDIKNYGDVIARNILAELIGWQGQDITIIDSIYEADFLEPGQETEFYWVIQLPVLSINTDVSYAIDARIYYDYHTNATKELIFEPRIQEPAISAGGGESTGPLKITISSMEPIYASDTTNFTVTLKYEDYGQGFVAFRKDDGTEDPTYKYYIKDLRIRIPDTWTPLHPDQWNLEGEDQNELTLTTLEEFTDCTQCDCPAGYSCDQANIKRCYKIEGMSYEYVPANSCNNTDRRLHLVRGERASFGVGFQRGAVPVETVDITSVSIDYSYAITTPNSLSISVHGQEQTY
jgi:hypothetical protein